MNLIEKLRTGMEQVGQAAKQAGAPMPGEGQAEYAKLANRLAQSGVACVAEVGSIEETGRTDPGGRQYAIGVRVEDNGDPYDATVEQFLVEGMKDTYAPGTRWEAKADPEDRCRLLLYSQAP